jgi:hypothetical protein
MWVAIHRCMEAMTGISLYSYLYPKLTRLSVFLIIACVFSSTKSKNKAEQVQPGSRELRGRGRWHKQCMYMKVNVKTVR